MKKLITSIFIAGMLASCSNMNNPAGAGMSNDKGAMNEARLQQFYDQVFNAHNVAMIDSFCTPDFIDHTPQPGNSGKGIADLKTEIGGFFTAYPDIHIKADYMASKGDTVIAKLTMTGTNTGPMMGGPATNKSINIDGVDIIVLKNGVGAERWGYFDDMKMMAQLGMMPEPGKMGEQKPQEGKMEKMGKMADEKMGKMEKKKK